jgi:lipopolysaccharide/colanic/teichoic acid biosynthesis glycosyltransferase
LTGKAIWVFHCEEGSLTDSDAAAGVTGFEPTQAVRDVLSDWRPATARTWREFAKRGVDVGGATAGLLLLAPLLALLAALVKLDSPGPVLFEQTRVGLRGKAFRMLKFRTMREGADDEQPSVAHLNHTDDSRLFKIVDDPRVTRLGRIIRRWSLDELPQLVNILAGEMSLVGPRPFFESDLADYEAHHFGRLAMKPGLTGLWQISGRSDIVDFEEVVRLDREYIERWSLALDFRILALTIPTVAKRQGAY